MPSTASDRALRELVAEFAMTTAEDMAAVLGMLDTKTAAQVRALLAAYGDIDDVFDIEADAPYVDTSGVSDWLAARIQGRPMYGAEAYRMTPGAVEALRAVAGTLPPQLSQAKASSSPAETHQDARNHRFRSLFGQGGQA